MTRKKVKLAFIANDSARKATFRKRKKSLMKKVEELSTLCGIDVCAILFSPYDSQPEVWPSPLGVQSVLAKFREMPEMEKNKKMVNQEGFLKQRIFKAKEQVHKQRKDNREKEMTHVMFQYLSGEKFVHHVMNMVHLKDLTWVLDQNLRDITMKMEALNNDNNQTQVVAPASPDGAGSSGTKAKVEPELGLEMNLAIMQRQQWFMDLSNCNATEMLLFGDVNHQIAMLFNNPFSRGNVI